MKFARPLVFCLLAAVLPAMAQVYEWKDSSGRTVISDSPPPGNAKAARTLGAAPAPGAAAKPAADAPKTLAEQDMEFRKRRQEAKEKAEKDAKELAAAAERKDNCERATRQLAALESGENMVARDAGGERHFLEAAERQQEIDRTRKIMAETCK